MTDKNTISRRKFVTTSIGTSSAVGLAFLGYRRAFAQSVLQKKAELPYPVDFKPTPNKLLDLPAGFHLNAFSRVGEKMDDGLYVPGKHDGMGAFLAPDGNTILIRNHELNAEDKEISAFGWNDEKLTSSLRERLYDPGSGVLPSLGGTTTLIYDTHQQELKGHFLSLAGTLRNCAGGKTPWHTWISCEETVQRAVSPYEMDHGYPFEVPATSAMSLVAPLPLKEMGRFNREAVAIDPHSGCVYQTEDRWDALFYRFVPNQPRALQRGGKLQALKIRGIEGVDTSNWRTPKHIVLPWTYKPIPVGDKLAVEWVDLENVTSPADDLRQQGYQERGAARFARSEGLWYGAVDNSSTGHVYIACTLGGRNYKGQIWQYTPSPYEGTAREDSSPGSLQLFVEPNDSKLLEGADNLTVAPWGDLIVCEDGGGEQYLVGITPEGQLYRFARNAGNTSEFAGATFSPDGTTLFVNVQNPGITLAITGDWTRARELAV
ncbi:MAG: DUF839 domain-containing protein [Pseudomonadota bacterium]|nr:DUF839 domain-containing protein [Pseudomonadota bacterium]